MSGVVFKKLAAQRGELREVMPLKPRWDCHDKKEQDLLEAWTNKQLDEQDVGLEEERMNSENYEACLAAVERIFSSQAKKRAVQTKKRAVTLAVKNKDKKALNELMSDPESARLAVREFTRKPSRGRKKGEPRPADIPGVLRFVRMNASDDVDRIKSIWKREFDKQNRKRGEAPTAIAIAARRHRIDEDDLRNWRKNHP